jgi:hypothetical protein
MKMIIKLIFIILSFEYLLGSFLMRNHTLEQLVGKHLKHYQVGLANALANGPLSDEEVQQVIDDESAKEGGGSDGNVGIVTISDNLRNKNLGNVRIKSTGMRLVFPTDTDRATFEHPDDLYKNRLQKEKDKIKSEKSELIKSEKDFGVNPFKNIYDNEKTDMDAELIKQKNFDYQKNLLSLAVEKEADIYNKMVQNDLNEIRVKKYNKGIVDKMYRHNLWHDWQ